MARPKKGEIVNPINTQYVGIRISPKEKVYLENKAKQENLSLSQYIKNKIGLNNEENKNNYVYFLVDEHDTLKIKTTNDLNDLIIYLINEKDTEGRKIYKVIKNDGFIVELIKNHFSYLELEANIFDFDKNLERYINNYIYIDNYISKQEHIKTNV